MHEMTQRKLYEMRLSAMADAFENQLLDPNYQALSFEERFGLLVDMEWSRRKNKRLAALIRKAECQQSNANIENLSTIRTENWIKHKSFDSLPAATSTTNSISSSWGLQELARHISRVPSESLHAAISCRLNMSTCRIY
jgi:site-specific DNA-adenine methylase